MINEAAPPPSFLLPYRHGVGICLVNTDNKIFVGKRIDIPTAVWQMPQGGIDLGETPEDAAVRELYEETGITEVQILASLEEWLCYDFPPTFKARFDNQLCRGQRQKWFLMRFMGQDSRINLQSSHPEFSQWMWMEPSLLLQHVVDFKAHLYKTIIDQLYPQIFG